MRSPQLAGRRIIACAATHQSDLTKARLTAEAIAVAVAVATAVVGNALAFTV